MSRMLIGIKKVLKIISYSSVILTGIARRWKNSSRSCGAAVTFAVYFYKQDIPLELSMDVSTGDNIYSP